MNYLARLDQLDYRRSLATPVARRVVLLTGQSSFRSSRLTGDQLQLLRGIDHATPIELGFPFHPDFDRHEEEPGLLAASFRNTRQFLWTFKPQKPVARALQPLFTHTAEALFIITGSCGLQLLNSAWPFLERRPEQRLQVVAIGPASLYDQLRPAAIRGRRDLWSRLLYKGPITAHCDCGHLDYWRSQEVREWVKAACV